MERASRLPADEVLLEGRIAVAMDDIDKIATACRVLGKLDMTVGALGHVSMRIGDTDTMYIKGKGPDEVGIRYTQREDILTVDFDANKIDGPKGLQPASESYMHIWLYKKNPEVRSVVHVHPMYAQLLTACDKPILPFFAAGPMGHISLEEIPTYPRGIIIANDTLGEDLANFQGKNKMALLQGHGVSVTGDSVEDSTVRTLGLAFTLEMTYKAYLLGNPRSIVQEDIDDLRRSAGETNRPRGSAGGRLGMLASWRYYCMLAGEDYGIEGLLADL